MRLEDHLETRIGFISPNAHNFCATCNRVRLTVEGRLLLCLAHENAIDLRGLLRRYCAKIRGLGKPWSARPRCNPKQIGRFVTEL